MRNIWTLFEHPDRDEVLKAPFYQYLWLLKTVRFRFIQGLANQIIASLGMMPVTVSDKRRQQESRVE